MLADEPQIFVVRQHRTNIKKGEGYAQNRSSYGAGARIGRKIEAVQIRPFDHEFQRPFTRDHCHIKSASQGNRRGVWKSRFQSY